MSVDASRLLVGAPCSRICWEVRSRAGLAPGEGDGDLGKLGVDVGGVAELFEGLGIHLGACYVRFPGLTGVCLVQYVRQVEADDVWEQGDQAEAPRIMRGNPPHRAYL